MSTPPPENQRDERDDAAICMGTRYFWGHKQLFGLSGVDRRQHLYLVGKTGSGKTTLLRNLILQDIEMGRGVGLIDPHGDLAHDLLDHIPSWRTDHVVYFNPADREYPISLNLLAPLERDRRHRMASGLVGAFKNIWHDSWGPRLEYVLYAVVASLLECRNVSLLGVQRMLWDERFRSWVIEQIRDPLLVAFWTREFEQYDRRMISEILAPLQNKVGQFLLSPPVRNIIGQVRNRVEPRFIMDKGRIFIANLSKGLVGSDKSNLLGAALVSQFELAAMSRADTPERERRDFHLYIDEFQNFSTDSFASILSEARKYRLSLTLSHQYLDQLRPEIGDAVFGNVGSMVTFRVGNTDAERLAHEMGDAYTPAYLSGLENFEVCARLLTDGRQTDAFLGKTFPPLGKDHGRRDAIVERSRQRYCLPRYVVEEKIGRWMQSN